MASVSSGVGGRREKVFQKSGAFSAGGGNADIETASSSGVDSSSVSGRRARTTSGSEKGQKPEHSKIQSEIVHPKIQPPPLYPPLDAQCLPLLSDENLEEILVIKNNLLANFRARNFYICKSPQQQKSPHPCDSYQPIIKRNIKIQYDLMPEELWSDEYKQEVRAREKDVEKREDKKDVKKVKEEPLEVTSYNLNELFERYEAREKVKGEDGEGIEKKYKEEPKGQKDEGTNEEEMAVDDEDEELDDGTDYYQQHFDDDEEYAYDADDGGEEGPTM